MIGWIFISDFRTETESLDQKVQNELKKPTEDACFTLKKKQKGNYHVRCEWLFANEIQEAALTRNLGLIKNN